MNTKFWIRALDDTGVPIEDAVFRFQCYKYEDGSWVVDSTTVISFT